MAIAKKTWTGLAREATPGTAVANPTLFMPAKSKAANKTKFVYVDEDRNTRDVNNDRVATIRMANITLDGAVYTDTIGYLLLGFMGADAVTQPNVGTAPNAYQHAFSLADTPPSLTVFKGYDSLVSFYWAYAAVEKLKFKFDADGKLLEHSSSLQGQFKVNYTGGTVPTYTNTPKPLAGYTPTIKFNTVASSDVNEMEIDLEQKITLFYPAAGSRAFAKVYYGDRKAQIKFTARFDTTTLFDNAFVNEQDQAIDVAFTGANLGGTVLETFQLTFPIVGVDDADVTPVGEYWAVKYAGTARPGAAVNSLFTATVINKVTSYAN